MKHGPNNKSWKRLLLGTALGGFLLLGQSALAAVPDPTAPVVENTAEAKKLIADAQAAIKNGNIRLALINLRNAIRVAPSNNDAHFQLGLLLFRIQDLAGAEREMRLAWKGGAPEKQVLPYLYQIKLARLDFQQLLDEFPDPGLSASPTAPDLLKARASALQRLGRAPEALDAMERSLKLRRDGLGLMARGSLAVYQGDVASADKFADEAFKKSPDNIAIAIFRLSTLRMLKGGAGARQLSDELLAKFPNSVELQFAHIEILLDQQQYPAAKTEIDALLAKYPQILMVKYYKALLASRTGDRKGAWDIALTLPKEFVEQSSGVGLMVAKIAFDAGRPEVAATTLGRLLRKDAGNLPARSQLASLYLDQGSANSALTVLGPVKDSSDPGIVRLLARTYDDLDRKADAKKVLERLGKGAVQDGAVQQALRDLRAGRTEQAIKALKEAAAKEPGNPAIIGPLVGTLAQAQRYSEALAAADRLGQNPSQRVAALVYRGDILLLQRKIPEARIAFDKAVGLEPKNSRALLVRANFFVATRKYDDAAKDLRVVLSSDSKNIAARIQMAQIAAQQGKDQEARKVLEEAIALAPQDASPRLALIHYLVVANDHKAALKAADDLVGLQPANVEGVALRGQSQSALGQKQEAVTSFRRLVSLTPNEARSQIMLGDALFAAGDRTGAQRALDDAAKLDTDSTLVKAGQINLQLALGNADAALASARAFQASHPGSQADILLADALAKAKRLDQAEDVLRKSLAGKPDQSVLSKLVALKLAMNDKKAAATVLSQWLIRNPNDIAARQALAMILMGEKDNAGARAQYEAILKQDAGNALAMNNLGNLIQDSDPGRAAALFTKAVQLTPNSADVNDSLGWLKVQQKDAAGGLSYLKRAHDLRPKDASITYHLAVALDANSKRNEARALLKTLLASGGEFPDKQAALKLSSEWR